MEGLNRQRDALQSFKEASHLDPTNRELAEIVSEIEESLAKNSETTPLIPQYGAPIHTVQASSALPTRAAPPMSGTVPLRQANPVDQFASVQALPSANQFSSVQAFPPANQFSSVQALPPANGSKFSPLDSSNRMGSRRASESASKAAGVGVHIVLDDSRSISRIIIMRLAPWSPLQVRFDFKKVAVLYMT